MAENPRLPAVLDFAMQVERRYAALIASAEVRKDAEPSLGGKLLFCGELGAESNAALLVAANIAGAASLAASADLLACKQALRDGIVDFMVTSLDEALRILKNEIRKGETVAVCVAAAPEPVAREMRERGVAPDRMPPPATDSTSTLLAWSTVSAPALWLPKLDALALACLPPEDGVARRWLRLAPRYLGRLAKGLRLLRCDEETAQRFMEAVQASVRSGEIAVAVELMRIRDGSMSRIV